MKAEWIVASLLSASTCLAGHMVDVKLPGTNTIIAVSLQINGTAYRPFDTKADYGLGIGTKIGITNFVASQYGVALSIKANRRIPVAWQTFTRDGKTIRSPIVKTSSFSASLEHLPLNTWVPLGGMTTDPEPAQIRIRRVDSQQSPAGDVLKAAPEE
jgi:hypothetical protein